MSEADPFGTARLRDAVLDAWRGSPTRFREDANAEEDLRLGGYRDRLLVELAQNAADAAGDSHGGGTLRLTVVDGELRAANTGAPLDAEGVAALASLRASAKRTSHAVGRFGVGFSAVLTVSDEPALLSSTGGVAFSATRTRKLVSAQPELADALAARDGQVPVLRLPWPVDTVPPAGFATEVRLPLRPEIAVAALLAELGAQAADLLLALPGLDRLEIGELAWWRESDGEHAVVLHGPSGPARWLLHRASGTFDPEIVRSLGVEARERPQWSVCWAVPVTESLAPQALSGEVLQAPTPTDEGLSLPARLLATLPVEPSRRRLLPGPATDAVLAGAIAAFPSLVLALPAIARTALVPLPGFPLSEVDSTLRDGVLGALRATAWLPLASGKVVPPREAVVLDVYSVELAELLADVVPGLLDAELSTSVHAKPLAALDVRRLRPADVADAVAGIDRAPSWWARLYAALSPVTTDAGELGALPVPLLDGRVVTGPRDVLLPSAELVSTSDFAGLRVAHPDAVHPLLLRLGAREAGPAQLLDALRDSVERSVEDVESGVDIGALVDLVLRLVELSGSAPEWLPALALPDAHGGWRRADELLLPDAALLDVLAPDVVGEDAPMALVLGELASHWPSSVLASAGVLDGFAVVVDEAPHAPDHDLADEEDWWDAVDGDHEPPAELLGVRDLDLVCDDAWPAALRLLAGEPRTWRALVASGGYLGWWLARHALLAGHPPRHWRLAKATALSGLYDPVPLELPANLLAAVGVRAELAVDDAEEATELLRRLGDPEREIQDGVVLSAHRVLAEAVRDGVVDPADVRLPGYLRTLEGVEPAKDAVVLDQPWLIDVVPLEHAVPIQDVELAGALADLLDVPLATEEFGATVDGGSLVRWSALGAVELACSLLGVPVPSGGVFVHDALSVGGARVRWWVSEHDTVHAEDTPEALARALAFTIGRWPDRWLLAALLADPDLRTALS